MVTAGCGGGGGGGVDWGEGLLHSQALTAVQRERAHGSLHPNSLSCCRFHTVCAGFKSLSVAKEQVKEKPTQREVSARWRFYSCGEESDHVTHVTVTVHRAFISVKSPLCPFNGITHGNE